MRMDWKRLNVLRLWTCSGVPVVACVADGDMELSMDVETLKGLYA